jgi:hypothetical protein
VNRTSSANYGTPGLCPEQYIVEYDRALVYGGSYEASVAPLGFIASATSCPLLTATIGVYFWDPTNGVDTYHHGITSTGAYSASTNSCYFATTPVIGPTTSFRVVTSLKYTYGGTTTRKRHYSRLHRTC